MQFPALSEIRGVVHRFLLRHPSIEVKGERAEVLKRLEKWHQAGVVNLGFEWRQLARAEQVHGTGIALIEAGTEFPVVGMDGLITMTPGVLLGIYVADCCAVSVVDRVNGALGLAHAGRKGAEGGIVPQMIQRMGSEFGSKPENLVVQLSPCIRPPQFEIDFAALIRKQAIEAGVSASMVHDEGLNTAEDLTRYYSYRMEKGKTGRMLALLGTIK